MKKRPHRRLPVKALTPEGLKHPNVNPYETNGADDPPVKIERCDKPGWTMQVWLRWPAVKEA